MKILTSCTTDAKEVLCTPVTVSAMHRLKKKVMFYGRTTATAMDSLQMHVVA